VTRIVNDESITIEHAGPQDAPAIAPLFDAYRHFYGKPSDPDGALEFIATRLGRGESVVLLARDGDTAVGFTQLYPVFSSIAMRRTWILNDLFVDPDHRKRGVARRLMEKAMAFAAETGAVWIELETAEDNHAAQALYDSLGFTREEGFHHYARSLDAEDTD
jgi:ribosomal protein S18 acetylase RimI-like enzyme